ncbi:peptidase C69 [Thermosipho melanesiensis]|uniref:Peptidase U62, modulator of DNA gyrase n=2 Tax=Thermosipho melanesiensis TaxID=46541 RepID=A6LJ34_THEM4|nr:TldD/PmbA family protein [Thermosipho melanesiensis]ABR29935.1 peptidase U62, modulator of DNA gyrase [Thermosipho melanesiensis BI429]APT73143.1 peptidase C69 [Thermosipho melanesiensis]OOC38539.1 peptidase C69 [Thermosipho melanesiensis]OOC40343.1 peptidase C69 [Thermosipho melanesiensis]OOC40607.1 peptidase C69 [Thermosipho melanesiensis]
MLNKSLIQDIIGTVLKYGGDFAEVFVEKRYENKIELSDGFIQKANTNNISGIGIRGFLGNKAIYAYTNIFEKDNLLSVAKRVGEALSEIKVPDLKLNFDDQKIKNRHIVHFYPKDIDKTEKAKIMKKAYHAAKNFSELIKQVLVWYWEYDQEILVANSEGVWAEDRRVKTRLMINTVAEHNGNMERGFYGPGAGMGFEFFNIIDVEEAAKRAARIAARMVDAEPAPAGKMPVIISNEFGGVIFHEAVGHALEATSVAKGASVFAGKLGQKIAAECVSAVDDATIPNGWGSANIDDEGTPTRRNLLIDKGVLVGYLIDKLGGRRMNMESTGSARRQDYTFAPTSRMSNTFILPGKYYPEEIIAATEYGLYAKTMGGGSVMPSTGEFNFAVMEAYLIENGKITKPVKGATLIGKGYEIIQKIDMVGNDVARGQGVCGSISGGVPADVGQPTIRVSEILVGGRNK